MLRRKVDLFVNFYLDIYSYMQSMHIDIGGNILSFSWPSLVRGFNRIKGHLILVLLKVDDVLSVV